MIYYRSYLQSHTSSLLIISILNSHPIHLIFIIAILNILILLMMTFNLIKENDLLSLVY